MSKIVLDDTVSGYNLQIINDNFDKLEQELQNKVLYRDNPEGEPNTMQQDLDMNGNDILNVGTLHVTTSFSVNGVDLASQVALAQQAVVDTGIAGDTKIAEMEVIKADTQAIYDGYDVRELGDKAIDPTLDNQGNPLQVGAQYWNTASGSKRVWNGTTWNNVTPAGIMSKKTYVADVVEDFVSNPGKFIPGTTTSLTLPTDPLVKANVDVVFDTAWQQQTEFSISGTTLTFTSAIPIGVAQVEVSYTTPLQITEIIDGAVTTPKLADEAVTNIKVSPTAAISTDKLAYTAPGTSSVVRSLTSKISEITSVLDFGADPTGAIGSRPHIQAAIDAVSAAGGGIVFIPAGTYSISSSSLLIPSKVSLIGEGIGATKLVVNGGNSLVSLATASTDVVISDIWFYGDYAGTDSSSSAITVNTGTQRVRIERCRIENMNFNGIDVNVNNRDVIISQCHIETCNVGISIFKGNSRCEILDNHFINVRTYGINIDDATASDTVGTASPNTKCIVRGNRIYQAGNGGIVVQGSSYINISSNIIEDGGRINPVAYTASEGIVINSGQGDFNRSQFCTVSGNTISGCTAAGIKVQGANQCVISNNIITDNWQWLSALSSCPEIDIRKNTTNGSTSIVVTGNIVADNATTNGRADIGIRITDTSSTNCHIGGNAVIGFAIGTEIVTLAGSGGTKFFGHEVLTTLPTWSSSMRSRVVHNLTDDKFYLATNTAWVAQA